MLCTARIADRKDTQKNDICIPNVEHRQLWYSFSSEKEKKKKQNDYNKKHKEKNKKITRENKMNTEKNEIVKKGKEKIKKTWFRNLYSLEIEPGVGEGGGWVKGVSSCTHMRPRHFGHKVFSITVLPLSMQSFYPYKIEVPTDYRR